MARPVVLVVDDEAGVRESFRLILDDDYEVIDGPTAPGRSRSSARPRWTSSSSTSGCPGWTASRCSSASRPSTRDWRYPVTAVKTVRTAVAAMKHGAFDYVTKPFDEDELLALVRRALDKRTLEREVVYLRGELSAHARLRRAGRPAPRRCSEIYRWSPGGAARRRPC